MDRILRAGLMGLLIVAAGSTASQASAQEAKKEKRKGLVDQVSGQGYGTAGCGLGSILFGEKEGMVQVFASTTNGIYSNNTFGVTSGTSNCAPESGDAAAAQIFVESNRLAMQNDVARGQGETLSAFYTVVNCKGRDELNRVLQSNFQQIFKADASNEQLVDSIRKTIRTNRRTANDCPTLG